MSQTQEILISTIKNDFNEEPKVMILDPRNDGIHLEAIVISEEFNTLSLVKRHQMVMKALKEPFATFLHALALKTFTPEEWKQQNKDL